MFSIKKGHCILLFLRCLHATTLFPNEFNPYSFIVYCIHSVDRSIDLHLSFHAPPPPHRITISTIVPATITIAPHTHQQPTPTPPRHEPPCRSSSPTASFSKTTTRNLRTIPLLATLQIFIKEIITRRHHRSHPLHPFYPRWQQHQQLLVHYQERRRTIRRPVHHFLSSLHPHHPLLDPRPPSLFCTMATCRGPGPHPRHHRRLGRIQFPGPRFLQRIVSQRPGHIHRNVV